MQAKIRKCSSDEFEVVFQDGGCRDISNILYPLHRNSRYQLLKLLQKGGVHNLSRLKKDQILEIFVEKFQTIDALIREPLHEWFSFLPLDPNIQ